MTSYANVRFQSANQPPVAQPGMAKSTAVGAGVGAMIVVAMLGMFLGNRTDFAAATPAVTTDQVVLTSTVARPAAFSVLTN